MSEENQYIITLSSSEFGCEPKHFFKIKSMLKQIGKIMIAMKIELKKTAGKWSSQESDITKIAHEFFFYFSPSILL
jgi:hypothetical protein